jgi:YVTN family beta-propeller protein
VAARTRNRAAWPCRPAIFGTGLLLALLPALATGLNSAAGSAAVTTISVAGNPYGVAIDPATDTAYVADRTAGAVTVIDVAAGRVTATIRVGPYPTAVAVDPVTDVVYVVNDHGDSVSVIDGATNSVTQTITGLAARADAVNGVAVDPVTDLVYVGVAVGSGEGAVKVIDGATGTVTHTITGPGGFPLGVTVDPVTDTVYAAFGSFLPNTVLVISGHTNAVSTTIALSGPPQDIAADPATGTFYIANYGETVSKYSGATDVLTGTASVGGLPRGVAVNPDTGTVYATVTISSTGVSLIGEATATVMGTIPVADPAGPVGIAADPATDTLVVTAPGVNRVFVIPLHAPVIDSGGQARFTAGAASRFTVHATGTPAPAFSQIGRLPGGVTLSRQGILSGTPRPGTGGIYHITITAATGVSPAATQPFTLTVDQAPAFTSANHAVFTAGIRHRYTVRTSGFPAARITEQGRLPHGVRFTAHQNGTATIAGVPAISNRGRSFVIRIIASNGAGRAAVQRFTLRVR